MRASRHNLHTLLSPLAKQRMRRPTRTAPGENPDLQALWHAVAMIPAGQVSTYGEVARAAGLPGRARQAGYALRVSPAHLNLPWHRVVGAGGKIVFPQSSRHFREQVRLLRGEGVAVRQGRVSPAALARL
jgi:methylated-DNA-protein-cysteine methyltransferase-like protein